MPYGCHNKPRPTKDASHLVQDGWFVDESGMTRKPRMKRISTAFNFDCQHDQSAVDRGCDGCMWRKE